VALLTLHLWIGDLVAVLALAAVWWRVGRRIALYVVTAQIVLGIVLVPQWVQAPWYHYALAVLGWAGYMVANGIERRGATHRAVLIISAISSIVLLVAFAIGHAAVQHAPG
jgi:Kef-type K+ transport system membrane component KefB